MICFHLLDCKLEATLRTDTLLPLIGFSLLFLSECADTEIFLIPSQDIFIDTGLFRDIFILHKLRDFSLKFCCIVFLIFELIIEYSPSTTFHFSSIVWEHGPYPIDHTLKVEPELIRIRFMLMSRHIFLDSILTDP